MAKKKGKKDERRFLQGEIERVDREWELERGELVSRTKGGTPYAPKRGMAIVLAFMPLGLFAFPVMMPEAPWYMWAFSSLMALSLWVACWQLYRRAVAYEAAHASWTARRAELVAKLEAANGD